ncbi:MAG: DUF4430 domain-containing protein, partial [Defluviitaleaceae bacterium]|nr:DUF4430 domain-containing protein [Defluviitaleaceae bacterium]
MQKTKTFSRLIAVLMTFTLVCGLLTAPMFASSDSNNPNDTAHSFGIEKALISPAALTSFNLSEWQDALDSALAWIVDNMPNPSIIDDWEVLTLARANAGSEDWFAAYLTALETELDNLETWADFQRATLALTALGFDATNFNGRDLTESFRNYVPASQRPYHSQGVNADIFALLALDSGAYTGDRELFVNAILAAQAESGSWAWTGAWGAWPAADLTAMAIQALALYYENPSVAAAISAGFSWIVEEYISDAETFAQIIIAGTALGRCVEATVVGLMNFYDAETGGFISPWTGETDAMSTEQAARALVAYYRFVNGMNAFFDMSDANERTTNGGNNGNGRPPILPPPPPQGRVFLSIRNDHASPNQRVLYEGYFNLTANETAFSLLNRTNLNIVTRGAYVVSIGGLREFDYGPQSGWMFTLNGVFPQFAAASAQLSNGDRVEWLFTINLGEDVGGGTLQPPPRPPLNVATEENEEEEEEEEEELTPPEADEEPAEAPATENNAPQETENEINETVPIVPITQWTNPFADVTPNDWFYP